MARIAGEAPPARARALVAALVALVLLVCGAVEALPGPGSPPAAAAGTAGAASTSSPAPATAVSMRPAGPAALPFPTGPGDALAPGAAPPLLVRLATGPPSRSHTLPPATVTGSTDSRAPPRPAGT